MYNIYYYDGAENNLVGTVDDYLDAQKYINVANTGFIGERKGAPFWTVEKTNCGFTLNKHLWCAYFHNGNFQELEAIDPRDSEEMLIHEEKDEIFIYVIARDYHEAIQIATIRLEDYLETLQKASESSVEKTSLLG